MSTSESNIEVGGRSFSKNFLIGTLPGQAALRDAKDSPSRPRCLCCPGKPEMYISRRAGNFFLSRMPGSANEHAEGCRSHLADPSFPAFAENSELTAGQLLDQLWEKVLANGGPPKPIWSAMQWVVVSAANAMQADGKAFAEHLLVPDHFSANSADKHKDDHAAFYNRQAEDTDKQVRYWTLGMLKDIVERPYSYQATLKHMPSTKFWVHKDLFDIFPSMPRPDTQTVICLFSCRRTPSGVEVDEAATLLLGEDYRPIAWRKPLPSAPDDAQIEQVRIQLGLPQEAGRDAVFGALVDQFLKK